MCCPAENEAKRKPRSEGRIGAQCEHWCYGVLLRESTNVLPLAVCPSGAGHCYGTACGVRCYLSGMLRTVRENGLT